jgi:hypothetical protein
MCIYAARCTLNAACCTHVFTMLHTAQAHVDLANGASCELDLEQILAQVLPTDALPKCNAKAKGALVYGFVWPPTAAVRTSSLPCTPPPPSNQPVLLLCPLMGLFGRQLPRYVPRWGGGLSLRRSFKYRSERDAFKYRSERDAWLA